ncbi:hypothetical protein Poli38472_001737 [Pythium oligandrum]|uniref:Uncharacterized protein n=1 Tax=Pythium oligandrum TaxID=41045 RepID=A0A8K1CVW9_PYTOL|nr:hypothetical protein Poli38472_001737 [Pythium oligandrum]|eukprot:TMW69581.1 hypothetical protein Poli38472_001737 [Pythium oligandrum]
MQSQLSGRASFATSDDTIGGPNVTTIVPNRVSSVPTVMATRIKGRGRLVAFLSLNAGFAYLHLSAALTLTHQWQLFLYAAFSLALKITIQEATKKYQLHAARMPSARIVHLAMSIPTLTIDAQIRMVIVQKSMHSSMQATSIVQGSAFTVLLCEVIFRLVKIYRLRYVVRSRFTKSKGMKRIMHRVNSKIAARDVTVARAEYAQFLNWKNYMLRMHAAEVYADMHGEYISVGMASAIVYFMHQHPCYRIGAEGESVERQMLGALFQIGTGLVFDYISSVFEGVHEVPLYESISDEGKGLRTFMHVLLGALTAGNVGVVVTFALQQCGG